MSSPRLSQATIILFLAALTLAGCGQTGGLPGLACHPASTWTTVDDFSPSANAVNEGVGITADIHGHVFVIGSDVDSNSNNHWIVRSTSGRGAAWSTVDDYQLVSTASTYPGGITADFMGGVYAVGNPVDGSGGSHWTVRKSSDGGATWKTIDDITNAQATTAVYLSSEGLNVFGELTSPSVLWASRETTNGGSSWTAEDSFSLSSNGAVPISAAADVASGALYTAGFAYDTNTNTHWIVRKSVDGGKTWSKVDDFQVLSSASSSASSVNVDATGAIYVAGNGSDASKQYWIVRKSVDGGATWTTLRKVQQHNASAGATGVGFDHLGNVYVCGQATDGSGNSQWLVEVSGDGGATWASSDSFTYSGSAGSGLSGQALGFAASPTGDLYVTGQVTLSASGNPARWITRALRCE